MKVRVIKISSFDISPPAVCRRTITSEEKPTNVTDIAANVYRYDHANDDTYALDRAADSAHTVSAQTSPECSLRWATAFRANLPAGRLLLLTLPINITSRAGW